MTCQWIGGNGANDPASACSDVSGKAPAPCTGVTFETSWDERKLTVEVSGDDSHGITVPNLSFQCTVNGITSSNAAFNIVFEDKCVDVNFVPPTNQGDWTVALYDTDTLNFSTETVNIEAPVI